MKIDLHMHTNFSACANADNSWQNLLEKAEFEKIDILSVTDHNTCDFYTILKNNDVSKIFSGKIIAGIELDVVEDGIAFELLAYNFNISLVSDWAQKTYGTLQNRQNKIKDLLISKIRDYSLKIDKEIILDEKEYAHKCVYESMIKYKENLKFFKDYTINNFSDFYRISTENKNFPLYISIENIFPGMKEVISIIHKAKGVVVLAHPYNYKSNANVEKLLCIAKDSGIDGIEVFHPSCNCDQTLYLQNYAKKYNLIITGGSDYHGIEKHNNMGLSDIESQTIIVQPNFIIQ